MIWTIHWNNVLWWKITCRHQKAKCENTSFKVFCLFNISCVCFFWSLLNCSLHTKCQKNKILILWVFTAKKNQYGWHGEIRVWLYKWLYSLEMVDFCWRMYIEKMRKSLGLFFRIGDMLLWWCSLLVFSWLKVKMWFFWGIKMCCMLHSKIVQSIKIFILINVEGISGRWCPRYWKKFLYHLQAPLGSKVKSLKKVKKWLFSNDFLYFYIFLDIIGV